MLEELYDELENNLELTHEQWLSLVGLIKDLELEKVSGKSAENK